MISVVIPAYNSLKTIGECIDSVLTQTRIDLIDEIIVVDDGSTDGTGDYVEQHYRENNNIVHLIKQTNKGVSSARNTGIKEAKSEWIALLDSDDIWKNNKIKKQWEKILKHPEAVFIGSNRNNENIHWGKRIEDDLYSLDLKHILIKNWPPTPTVMIKKSVFERVGLYDEEMRYAEDGDLWNRIAIEYPLFYISESLVICGGYKLQFGESGLSSNLKGMYEGNIRNIKMLRRKKAISLSFFVFLRLYNDMKYVRRILITKYKRKNQS